MNLIVCDQHCRHQEDGYCTLNHIDRLTNEVSAKCGYFQADSMYHDNGNAPHLPSAEHLQSL